MKKEQHKPRLSVIIVSYNSLNYLKQTISSIWECNDIGDELEIIVVDNSTESETIEWLLTQQDVVAIKNDNKGFGEGNNVGARIAKGEYLLFLNPDTILIEPIFRFAINKFEQDEKLGVFGVQLVDINKVPNSTYGLRISMGFSRIMLSKLLIKTKLFIPKMMYTSGADIFIRKKAFEDAGCFDEAIFMYCEEPDLINRVNACGYTNALFREKCIVHLEGKTSEDKLYNTYIRQFSSKKYYCSKYRLNFEGLLRSEKRYCLLKSKVLSLVGDTSRAAEYKKIRKFLKEQSNVGRGLKC